MSLMKTIIFLQFATSIAGPFFSVHVIQSLGGTNLDIAIISAIGTLSAIMFYGAWGMLVDYLGRKTVMLSCIIPISFLPFVYSVSNHVLWLYLYSIVSHISWAGFSLAVFAYLSDAVPFERSSYYVSVYNLFTGLSSAIAPFIGGIIADLTSIHFIFMLSTILRISTIYFIDRLEEKTGLRPRGIFNFRFDYFGIAYRLETFLLTYSLAIYEARQRSKRIMNLGKYLKSFERNMKDNVKKIRKKK